MDGAGRGGDRGYSGWGDYVNHDLDRRRGLPSRRKWPLAIATAAGLGFGGAALALGVRDVSIAIDGPLIVLGTMVRGNNARVIYMQQSAWSAPDTFVNSATVPTLLFCTDWHSDVGLGAKAILDSLSYCGTPWGAEHSSGSVKVIATADSARDYPTTNFLQLPNTFNGVRFDAADNRYDTVDVGSSIYVRYYVRYLLAGCTASQDSHEEYHNTGSGGNWGPTVAGTYKICQNTDSLTFSLSAWAMGAPVRRYWRPIDTSGKIARNVTYRVEYAVHRVSATTYWMQGRLYNGANGAIIDTSFVGAAGADNDGDPIQGDTFTVAQSSLDSSLRGHFLVLEDAQTGVTGAFAEYAAFAKCTVTWCGPYPVFGEDN